MTPLDEVLAPDRLAGLDAATARLSQFGAAVESLGPVKVVGPPGLRRSLITVAAISFAGGVLFALATGLGRHGDAAPVELTPAQAARLVRAHQGVIGRFPRLRANGHGNCTWVAQNDAWAFQALGVRPDAMRFEEVATPPGWRDPRHRMLRLDARLDGHPWRPLFDMNSPWPLDDRAARLRGYRPIPG